MLLEAGGCFSHNVTWADFPRVLPGASVWRAGPWESRRGKHGAWLCCPPAMGSQGNYPRSLNQTPSPMCKRGASQLLGGCSEMQVSIILGLLRRGGGGGFLPGVMGLGSGLSSLWLRGLGNLLHLFPYLHNKENKKAASGLL